MNDCITKDVWAYCVVPFFGPGEYGKCFRVSKTMQQTTQLGIRHRKHLTLQSDRRINENRLLHVFARYAKSLRVIDVRLSDHVCVDIMCELIRESPHLEAYMTASADDRILDALVRYCPALIALALCTQHFSLHKLHQFKHLKALELGSSREPMSMKPATMARIIDNHPNIVIIHVLSLRNTTDLFYTLNPDTIRSIALPYDREEITSVSISHLKRFSRLDNLNLGESFVTESVVASVARACPGLTKFSVSPKAFLSETLSQLSNENIFENVRVLGCRTPITREQQQDPVQESAFADLGAKRSWTIIDYAISTPKQCGHWCRKPFEFMTLLSEYKLISQF